MFAKHKTCTALAKGTAVTLVMMTASILSFSVINAVRVTSLLATVNLQPTDDLLHVSMFTLSVRW